MTIAVYVAAASDPAERARAAKWMAELRAAGVPVTSTWVETIGRNGGVGNPRDAHKDDREKWARENAGGIEAAGIFWFLVPSDAPGRGGYFETGVAHAFGKYLIFSGDTRQSVFCALGLEFERDVDAFDQICRIVR